MIYFLMLELMLFQSNPFAPQATQVIEEAEVGGQAFGKLFVKGPDAELLSEVGQQFLEISKPIQAEMAFVAAKKLDAKNETVGKGLDKSRERLKFLEGRIKKFTEEINASHDPITYNRRAAILYHMGRYQEALVSLDKGFEKNPTSRDIFGLRRTFEQGVRLEHTARAMMEEQFTAALSQNTPEQALSEFGKIVFSSLGKVEATDYLGRLSEKYPKLDMKKIKDVLALFQSGEHRQG